jgi:hypothetical protein
MPSWSDNEQSQVLRLTPDGFVEVIAGRFDTQTGDAPDEPGPAPDAGLSNPIGLAFDKAGDLYVCDSGNLKIRKVTGLAAGTPTMSTVVGSGLGGALALLGGAKPDDEGKPAREIVAIGPLVLAFDAEDNLYFAEAGTQRLTTLGGMGGIDLSQLPRIAPRIRRVGKDGTVKTIAGPGSALLNDPASDNSLVTPLGLAFDREGRLIVADSGNNQVKLIPKGAF